MKKKECAKNLTFDTPSFASPFWPFQPRFRVKFCVHKIQTTDYQCFKNVAKFAHLRRAGRLSRISQAERPKTNK